MSERELSRGKIQDTLRKNEVITYLKKLVRLDTCSDDVRHEVDGLIFLMTYGDRKTDFPNKQNNLLSSEQEYFEAINQKIVEIRQILLRDNSGDSQLSRYLRDIHPFFQ